MAKKTARLTLLDKLFIGLLLVVFGGIVLHAPLSVGLGTLVPSIDFLIKSWKEVLLVVATVCAALVLTRQKRWSLIHSPIVLLIAGYALLHLALLPVFWQGETPAIAGLMIDLRYLLFFVLVYVAMKLYPSLRRLFIIVFVAGALVVTVFALLQVFILPPDILKYLGYGPTTIMPYLTVDQNMDFIRINSTLRGPNPLGAYSMIVLTLVAAWWLRTKNRPERTWLISIILVIGGIVALWASYSRSALVAAVVAVALVVLVAVGRRFSKWVWIGIAAAMIVLGGAFFAVRESDFVSNVILHEDPEEGGEVNSNEGHVESLADGVERMVRQPLGGGIGSTGSASLYGESPLIIENQYLFIAHEAGWIGPFLFLLIFFKILKALWQRRADWLALGVLASGIGLALIGLLLPVWVDDTVAIIWWGLAAVAIGGNDGRAINQKTKRTA